MPTMTEWEQAEAKRSAAEASCGALHLVSDESQVVRYLDPPLDTSYPLEYAFHLLGDVRGRTVLEYGCGDGLNTVVLARREANVIALDISPDLIGVARRRLEVNGLGGRASFVVGSAHQLPVPDESVDVLFGIAILHHLDLALSAREVNRVLRPGGRAIFQEPVRNSRWVALLRNLIPYRSPLVSPFERPLTDRELGDYARGFAAFRSKPFQLPTTSLVDVVPPLRRRYLHSSIRWDAAVLRRLPALSHYATIRVLEMIK